MISALPFRAAFLLTVFAPAAQAILIAADQNTSGLTPNSAVYSGAAFTGVVREYASNGACSGSLFGSSRMYILTAAHCVAGDTGGFTAGSDYVAFEANGVSPVTDAFAQIFIAPGYTGASTNYQNDIAVVLLQAPAPSFAQSYALYTSSNEIGKDITIVGYGVAGYGATGPDGTNYPYSAELKNRRMGQNTYDQIPNFGQGPDTTHIAWDFKTAANSKFGNTEVNISPGDSGGPSFYNNQIIGVHSLDACATGPCTFEFGDVGADTRVSAYTSNFLAPFITSVPEPSSVVLLLSGFAGLFVLAFQKSYETRLARFAAGLFRRRSNT